MLEKFMKYLSHLITEEDVLTNPYIVQREINNVAIVVVTADRGLCGAFNTNLIKESVRYIKEELNNSTPYIYCVGKKGNDFFKKNDYEIFGRQIGLFANVEFENALEISKELIDSYLKGVYDKIVIIYNEFKSIIQQKIVIEQFLPIPLNENLEIEEKKTFTNYIYEPDQSSIFNSMLPKHLVAQVWRILLETNAAFLGAQMTAMDNATTNANELIRTLNLKYNKERQAAITKEILEIVSGANALKENG